MSETENPSDVAGENEAAPSVAPEKRNFAGWLLLVAFFIALVAAALTGKEEEKETSAVNAMEVETTLKMTLLGREFSELAEGGASASSKKEFEEQLTQLYSKVYREREKDSTAAKLTLTLGQELGKQPDAKALGKLEKSKDKADLNYAKVYSTPKLEPAWVAEAKKSFPETFLGKVVLTHALAKAGQAQAAKDVIKPMDALPVGVVFVGALFSFALGIVVIIWTVISNATEGAKPVGNPFTGLTAADSDRLAIRMAVFLLMFSFIPGLIGLGLRRVIDPLVATVLGEIVLLVAFGFFCKVPIMGVADPLKKIMGRMQPWPKLAGVGYLAFLANLPIVAVLTLTAQRLLPNAAPPSHPISEQIGAGASTLSIVMMYALAAVMAPILEELSFRGLLFPALAKHMKPVMAMIVSGLLFGMIHPQGPVMWASLAAIGAMSAYIAHRTGSLLPSMVMHAIHNGSLLTLSMVLLY